MTLATAIDRLINQVGHWTPSRWAASGAAPAVFALVQRLADLDADVEGRPRLPVPRLDSDLALPDQLHVVAADLIAAGPDQRVLDEAVAAVRATSRAIRGGA